MQRAYVLKGSLPGKSYNYSFILEVFFYIISDQFTCDKLVSAYAKTLTPFAGVNIDWCYIKHNFEMSLDQNFNQLQYTK